MSNLRVYSITSLMKMKSNPHYLSAKNGNLDEARTLVEELMNGKTLCPISSNEILLPIIAQEENGRNKIPFAIALYISELYGNTIETDIVQEVRANHTGSSASKRLKNVLFKRYSEYPLANNEYIIIDDYITMGGTVASLAKYIRNNGGVVNKVITISSGTRTIKDTVGFQDITPTQEEVNAVREKFGDWIEEYADMKYEEMPAPTIRYLLRFNNLENFKNRVIESNEYEKLSEKESLNLWGEFQEDYFAFLFGK